MPAQKIIVRPENHRKSDTSLTLIRSKSIVPIFSDVGELKRRIKSEWAALSHTVIECDNVEWRGHLHACVRAGADILSTYCNKNDVM